ncbi:MAG TPA: hypothetical protein VFW52_03375 [Candidatus Saccharimonadales bacterium]|nr:hypothetical protein [Candidatus Saccharimonadales bacterium]
MDNEQKPPQTAVPQTETPEPEKSPVAPAAGSAPKNASRLSRFRGWYGTHKKLSIPATVLVILLLSAAVPWSRYAAAGLVVKKNFNIVVLDSTSHKPVSGATVSSGRQITQTDGNGKASLMLSSGRHNLAIAKKYYKDQRSSVLVPILKQKSTPSFEVSATGRQVKIVTKNLINQQNLSNVGIKVADITAQTDSSGEAIVVLPAGVAEQKASLSLDGYNDAQVTVKVSAAEIAENDFNLTPAGKVYFISKRTGRLDMMKANLDGSDAQVVAAGTGREHDYDTQLVASPDTKYVALLSRRSKDYNTSQIYVLSTANDRLLGVDNAKAEFNIIGWSGNNLIYTVDHSTLPEWQPGRYKLKSYDASSGKINLLNQAAANGDETAYGVETYPFIMISGQNVVFAKTWSIYYQDATPDGFFDGKENTLSLISADGQGYKRLAAYDVNDYLEYVQHSPTALYIWRTPETTNKDSFYEYTVGASAPAPIELDGDQFYNDQQTPYTSGSGQKTLWSESRDGKFSLFVGDAAGLNEKTIQSLGKYDAYGWYGDDYILVTKDGTELYIMSSGGGKPVKITDFEQTGYFGHG